jgi:GT2 family glycosyltransferase
MTPQLSIVTGTLNRPVSFQRLVDSIVANTKVSWELVVSNASDESYEMELPANVRMLDEKPRLGCSRGYNRAFRAAHGKWCIWLNDDVEVLRGYDTESIAFMESHPKIGLGALYYREGTKDFHVNSFYSLIYANFGVLRRSLGEQVGWFDEELPMYGSDNALSLRILLAGHGIAAIPGAAVIHHAIQDRHRDEHNDYDQRIRDVEFLTEKYGHHMAEMRETYIRTGSTPLDGIHDQTPGFIREKVSG